MTRNRAHNSESRENRLARLQTSPIEAIESLLNSIDNYFNNEIRSTPDQAQTSLLFLGIHAAALTIGEVFFDNRGNDRELRNYAAFLEAFVDGPSPDTKFSIVAPEIHDWRNILAHQWLGSLGHRIEYDYSLESGWTREDDILVINPKLYCEAYLAGFARGGRIWRYSTLFTEQQLTQIQSRIVAKYERR